VGVKSVNLKMLVATAAAAATLTAGAASASTVVYDNGALNNQNGNEATEWVQTEDFMLGANTGVTGAGVYMLSNANNSNWDGNFRYYLFADNAGNPGAVLATGLVNPTVTDQGPFTCCGFEDFLFAFNFQNTFNAVGGTTYHLGIHAAADGSFSRDEVYWTTTNNNSTPTGIESDQGAFNNWSNNGQEHAFYLTGAGGAPEPASWALMIAGFGLAGATLRRRRAVVA